MSDPRELKEFAASALAKDLDDYTARAHREKHALMRGVAVTRALGAAALIIVGISATRLDQVILQLTAPEVDKAISNQIGQFITGIGLFLGTLTIWSARALDNRGYLRAWTRYSELAQRLRVYQHEIEFEWHPFSAINQPTTEDRKRTNDAIARFSQQAKQATLEETQLWASHVREDLGGYLKGAVKIAETVEDAKGMTRAEQINHVASAKAQERAQSPNAQTVIAACLAPLPALRTAIRDPNKV